MTDSCNGFEWLGYTLELLSYFFWHYVVNIQRARVCVSSWSHRYFATVCLISVPPAVLFETGYLSSWRAVVWMNSMTSFAEMMTWEILKDLDAVIRCLRAVVNDTVQGRRLRRDTHLSPHPSYVFFVVLLHWFLLVRMVKGSRVFSSFCHHTALSTDCIYLIWLAKIQTNPRSVRIWTFTCNIEKLS